MKAQNVSKFLIPLASVAVGVVVGLLAGHNQAKPNATMTTGMSHKLQGVRTSVLKECQDHEYSSLSEPYAPDMVKVREFIDFQLCSPEEAVSIVTSFDVDEIKLFFGCLKDMTSGAK